ncbi:hypothetical protein P4O66_014378 [Electrophorus voltai]|uniref:Troponin I4a n=1 Tax=Electrophorus voltai TaxID=2609070 RepID=A0AAD8Z2U7_9TELE|nr:hypothetical protein P4O66_014378 [Electrophorus voltai]
MEELSEKMHLRQYFQHTKVFWKNPTQKETAVIGQSIIDQKRNPGTEESTGKPQIKAVREILLERLWGESSGFSPCCQTLNKPTSCHFSSYFLVVVYFTRLGVCDAGLRTHTEACTFTRTPAAFDENESCGGYNYSPSRQPLTASMWDMVLPLICSGSACMRRWVADYDPLPHHNEAAGQMRMTRLDSFLTEKVQAQVQVPSNTQTASEVLLVQCEGLVFSFQTKLLRKAESLLVKEREQKLIERESTLKERAPPLKLSGLSVQELQEICKDLHHKIDIVDESRYDLELKVARNETEIQSLQQKVYELKGKMKRPNLKRVKKTADDKLGALTDTKLMKADFKANLKTVKKEEEKKEEVTDWRKNVEAMSGMEGRKKIFDAGQ